MTSLFLKEEINLRNAKLIAIVTILNKKRLISHLPTITILSKISNEKNKDFFSSQSLELENGCLKEANKTLSILINSS